MLNELALLSLAIMAINVQKFKLVTEKRKAEVIGPVLKDPDSHQLVQHLQAVRTQSAVNGSLFRGFAREFSGSFLYFSLVSLSVGDEALKKPNMSMAPGKPGPYKLFKGTQTQKDRLSVTRLFFSFISSGDSRRRKDKGLCLAFPSLFLAPVSSGSRRLFITVWTDRS